MSSKKTAWNQVGFRGKADAWGGLGGKYAVAFDPERTLDATTAPIVCPFSLASSSQSAKLWTAMRHFLQEGSMRRREFIAGIGGTVAVWPLAALAQKSTPRIGWLVYGDPKLGPIDQSLQDAIAQTGLVDGRNIEIVFRYANGKPDQLAGLADELVAQKPDLLL